MVQNGDQEKNLVIAQAVKDIVNLPPEKAEKAVEVIADRQGDAFAKEILAHLPPVKIAAILRQYDFSCPSVISWMMTPDLVGKVLTVDPLFWRHVFNRKDPGVFLRIRNEALQLLTTLLMNAESQDHQTQMLYIISSDDVSLQYLFLPFIGWRIQPGQTQELEDPEVDFGTPDHLFEIIRWAAPGVAGQILAFSQSASTSMIYFITDLWLEAFRPFENHRSIPAVENTMFRRMAGIPRRVQITVSPAVGAPSSRGSIVDAPEIRPTGVLTKSDARLLLFRALVHGQAVGLIDRALFSRFKADAVEMSFVFAKKYYTVVSEACLTQASQCVLGIMNLGLIEASNHRVPKAVEFLMKRGAKGAFRAGWTLVLDLVERAESSPNGPLKADFEWEQEFAESLSAQPGRRWIGLEEYRYFLLLHRRKTRR